MPKTAALFLALLALLPHASPGAPENPYDVLGKALVPVVSVLSPKSPLRALTLDAHLLNASKLPPEFQGQPVHLALNAPDRLLLSAPIAGEMMTVCRDGDDLWATPGSKIQYLIDQAASPTPGSTPLPEGEKPKKKKKHADEISRDAAKVMGPLELPIPAKDLVFLPVLFEVTDAGYEQTAGKPCRVLDVHLMPQLAQSLHAENWSARLWIGADYKLAQVTVTGPEWNATAAIDKLEISKSLPDAAFQPEGTDVLHLDEAQFLQLITRLGAR